MYAIVEITGKQYLVEKDMTIDVNRLKKEQSDITLDRVLLCVDGEKVLIGQPYLSNVNVKGTVMGNLKGKKVRGMKFKKRKRYTRLVANRPDYTRIKIKDISVG